MYKKVADSSDVVIQRQGFSIFDTHEPVNAMSPPLFLCHKANVCSSCRNQIFPVGHHQGVRRFVSPGLHHTKVNKCHCRMLHVERHTSASFGSFIPSLVAILCHLHALRMVFHYDRCSRAARKWWRGEGGAGVWRRGMTRTLSSGAI